MFEIIVTGDSLSLLHNTRITSTQQPHESSMAFFLRCVADAHRQHVPCAPIDLDPRAGVEIIELEPVA